MSGPSNRRFDLNLVEEAAPPSPDNIWRPSFVSPTGPLTVGDSVMKNDMTAAVVVLCLIWPNAYLLEPAKLNHWRAEVMSLKQEIRGLKHENKQLHRLAHDYATNMKRKLDQMKESDGQVLLDRQRFVGLFQRHLLPSSSGAVPRNEAPNDQPLMPPPSRVLSSTEASNDPPLVPSLSGRYRLLRLLLSNLCEGSLLFVYFDSCICTYL
ncbi:unnamed protein product [Malus baccata var. baccata]